MHHDTRTSRVLYPRARSRIGIMNLLRIATCLLCVLVLGSAVASAGDASDIDELMTRLGADQYADRETAQAELIERGVQADAPDAVMVPATRLYATTPDPEVRHRLREILRVLFEKHYLDRPQGFLGIRFNFEISGQKKDASVKVLSVTPGSAAEAIGLQPGDRILKVGELDLVKPESVGGLAPYIQSHDPGHELGLVAMRGEDRLELTATLGAMPLEQIQQLYPAEQRRKLFNTWLRQQVSTPAE